MDGYRKKFADAIARTPGVLLVDRRYVETGKLDKESLWIKDGRRALYFLNLGVFSDGKSGTAMGNAFAYYLTVRKDDFDVLIGPPYKGITIANETVGALWREFGITKNWAYRRKEAKDHGEKGAVVGAKLADGEKLWMVDDVISSAKTKIDEKDWFDKYANLKELSLPLKGLTVGVDRHQTAVIDEGGKKRQLDVSAATYFSDETGLPVNVVLPVSELMDYLHEEKVENSEGIVIADDKFMKAFEEYQKECGPK